MVGTLGHPLQRRHHARRKGLGGRSKEGMVPLDAALTTVIAVENGGAGGRTGDDGGKCDATCE
jgi:hypothetical protein